jgi:hypothetical protein
MSKQRPPPQLWRVECRGTEKRGCDRVDLTVLPRYVIFQRCSSCGRLRRNLLVWPAEARLVVGA